MIPTGPHELAPERAALIAAGAATPDEAAVYEPQLTETISTAGFGPVVRSLAAAIPSVDPPPRIKADILARLTPRIDPRAADRVAASKMKGSVFRFGGDGGFVPTPYPGVSARLLHVDEARRQFSVILRLDPGSTYPAHPHDGPEECIVLDGEMLVGEVRMRKGDYQRVEGGTDHIVQYSETGATLFITAPLSLLEQP